MFLVWLLDEKYQIWFQIYKFVIETILESYPTFALKIQELLTLLHGMSHL